MAEIAFKPLTPVKTDQVEAPVKIDTPDYPDKGTTYAGYSKTLYSGNTYQLNPQSQQDVIFFTTYGGGETSSTMTNPFKNKNDFYVTKLILSLYHTLAGIAAARVEIGDGDNARVMLLEPIAAINNEWILDFDPPLFFSKLNNFTIQYEQARTVGDRFCLNFYGWSE